MELARRDTVLPSFAALVACAVGCQGSIASVSFARDLVLSVTGDNISGTVPSPCEVDVDFGVVPLGQASSATIHILSQASKTVSFGAFVSQLDPELTVSPASLQPLAPAASTQLSVTFTATHSGAVSSSLTIPTDLPASACGSSSSSILVKLTGQGAQLSLSVAPNSLDFGTVLVGESDVETVTLTNRSSVAVSGLAATVTETDASSFTVGSLPGSLAAGASVPVQVTYSPMALENSSVATVTFGGGGGESATLSVSGNPVATALSVAPNPIDFGYVPLNTIVIACTTVSNAANVAVTISSTSNFASAGVFALSAVDDASPPASTALPIEVPARGSAEVCFTMSPLISMQYSGQLTLVTGDPSGINPVVQLTGWGGGPQISCTPASLDFGSVEAFTSKTLPVVCTNIGTAIPMTNLIIEPPTNTPLAFTAQFDSTTDVYPLNGLVPGQSAQIDVSYNPISTTPSGGSVVIVSNGGHGQKVVIPVSGQGLALGECRFEISPTAINFGNIGVGETSPPIAFEIRNVGTDICVINGLSLVHDMTSSFFFDEVPFSPFGPNFLVLSPPPDGGLSDLSIAMALAPTVQGTLSADVMLTIFNPVGAIPAIALAGTSEPSCLAISPTTFDEIEVFPPDSGVTVPCSNSVSLSNTCSSPITIQSFALQAGPFETASRFSIPTTPTTPFTLQPGVAPVVIDGVPFNPAEPGSYMAQLLISDGKLETMLPLTGTTISASTRPDCN